MTRRPLAILLEDNHLLAMDKPAGLPTMGAAAGQPTAHSLVKQYLKRKYSKPGNVYLGVVSRLDSVATGVLLFARTSKAAARMSDQFRRGDVEKQYLALVPAAKCPRSASWQDWIIKDENARRMRVAAARQPGAKIGRLSFRCLWQSPRATLLQVQLQTGRKHQIRVQLAHHGLPILGDRKYGSRAPFPAGIALHAQSLRFRHPVRQSWVELTAPIPPSWKPFGVPFETLLPKDPEVESE